MDKGIITEGGQIIRDVMQKKIISKMAYADAQCNLHAYTNPSSY